MIDDKMSLRVQSVAWESPGIRTIELRHPAGLRLPPASPGAHVTMTFGNGISRSYSLIEAGAELMAYRIAVARAAGSRGGSAFLHDQVLVGNLISVEKPRNSFPLALDAAQSLFIAGGIGITPFLAMAAALAAAGRTFALHHVCRDPDSGGFGDRLAPWGGAVRRYFTRVDGATRPDIAALVATAPRRTHLYCCGPAVMLEEFERVTADRDPALVHLERFAPREEKAVGGGFVVELARSGRQFLIRPGETILDRLLAEGLYPPHSCREGVCGQCETRVIEGIPDHRDAILSPAERAAGRTMMICRSGSKSPRLVLEL